jgi:hypothetical protein
MNYDETEIARSYDRARAFVPETARQWQELLSPYIRKRHAQDHLQSVREPSHLLSRAGPIS